MKKEYEFSQARRGAVLPRDPKKVRITIRLDGDIVEAFKKKVHQKGGGNYQTLMNEALREHLSKKQETLEKTLRRVIREELHA